MLCERRRTLELDADNFETRTSAVRPVEQAIHPRKHGASSLAPSVTNGSVQKIQNDSPKVVAMRCFSRFSEPFERDVARSRYRPVRGQAMRAWLAREPQRSHRHGHHLSPRTQYR